MLHKILLLLTKWNDPFPTEMLRDGKQALLGHVCHIHRSYETLENLLSYLIIKPCFINSVPVLPLQSIPYFTRYVESTSVKAKQRALTICKEISVKYLKHGTGFGNVSENRSGLGLCHLQNTLTLPGKNRQFSPSASRRSLALKPRDQAPQWGKRQKTGIGKISASEASPAVVWRGEKGGGAWRYASDAVDCLQSSFSLKIRLVLISSSTIANNDVIITITYWLRPRFSRLAALPLASLGFACSNFAKKKNKRLLAVKREWSHSLLSQSTDAAVPPRATLFLPQYLSALFGRSLLAHTHPKNTQMPPRALLQNQEPF